MVYAFLALDHALKAILAHANAAPALSKDEVSEEEDELKRAWVLLLLHYAQAYQLLSPRDRRALHLIEVEGLSYSEAGKHLGVGRSNMKMIMFRGRKRLRAHILGAMCQGNTGSSARAVS